MSHEILLYTALIGDYDELKEHHYPRASSFCFTDRRGISTNSWTLVPITAPAESIDARIRAARYYKTHPHLELPPHEHSIWIDASMAPQGSISALLEHLEGRTMATFKYPEIYGPRDCAYDEAEACIGRGKDSPEVIVKQMASYRAAGFPSHFGLAETAVVLRDNCVATREFNELWWAEISAGSRRDQLSFDYCCWRSRMEYSWIPGHRLDNAFARFVPHSANVYGRPPARASSLQRAGERA